MYEFVVSAMAVMMLVVVACMLVFGISVGVLITAAMWKLWKHSDEIWDL